MLNTIDKMERRINKGMRTEIIQIQRPVMKGNKQRILGKIYDGNIIKKDFVLWNSLYIDQLVSQIASSYDGNTGR